MKRIANLYLVELRPSRQRLTLRLLLSLNLALALIFVVLWGVGSFLLHQQTTEHENLLSSITTVERQFQQKQTALDEALNDPVLQSALTEAQETFRQRQRLLDKMQAFTQPNQQSYSQLLYDLAAADQPEIWLQRIYVLDNALTIEGYTQRAENLPIWLSSFSRYATLQNRPFGVFELSDDDEQGLRFIIGHLNNRQMSTEAYAGRQ
jgi:Tfp pilus assembly protein PilN